MDYYLTPLINESIQWNWNFRFGIWKKGFSLSFQSAFGPWFSNSFLRLTMENLIKIKKFVQASYLSTILVHLSNSQFNFDSDCAQMKSKLTMTFVEIFRKKEKIAKCTWNLSWPIAEKSRIFFLCLILSITKYVKLCNVKVSMLKEEKNQNK